MPETRTPPRPYLPDGIQLEFEFMNDPEPTPEPAPEPEPDLETGPKREKE